MALINWHARELGAFKAVDIYDEADVLLYKVPYPPISSTTVEVFKPSDESPWLQATWDIRSFAHSEYSYTITADQLTIATVIIRRGILGARASIIDSAGNTVGTVADNDAKWWVLSRLMYDSFTVYDSTGQTLAAIKHRDHDKLIHRSNSNVYDIVGTRPVDSTWEAIIVALTAIIVQAGLKYTAYSIRRDRATSSSHV